MVALFAHPATTARVRAGLERTLGAGLGLQVGLGKFELSLAGQFVAHDVRVVHPLHGTLLEVKELRAVPSLQLLWGGDRVLERVVLERPHVYLRFEDGTLINGPVSGGGADQGGGSAARRFGKLELRGGLLDLELGTEHALRLQDIDATLESRDDGGLGVDLADAAGWWRHEAGSERLQALRVTGSFGPKGVGLSRLALRLPWAGVELREVVVDTSLEPLHFQSSGRVRLDMGRLASLPLGVKLPALRGPVAFEGTLDIQGSDWRSEGALRSEGADIEGFGFGKAELLLSASPEGVELRKGSSAEIVEGGGRVMLAGRLGLSPGLPLSLALDLQHMEFQKLMKQLSVTDGAIVDWVLSGPIQLEGQCVPLRLDGPLRLVSERFSAFDRPWLRVHPLQAPPA